MSIIWSSWSNCCVRTVLTPQTKSLLSPLALTGSVVLPSPTWLDSFRPRHVPGEVPPTSPSFGWSVMVFQSSGETNRSSFCYDTQMLGSYVSPHSDLKTTHYVGSVLVRVSTSVRSLWGLWLSWFVSWSVSPSRVVTPTKTGSRRAFQTSVDTTSADGTDRRSPIFGLCDGCGTCPARGSRFFKRRVTVVPWPGLRESQVRSTLRVSVSGSVLLDFDFTVWCVSLSGGTRVRSCVSEDPWNLLS